VSRRSIAEVESSIEAHRRELAHAIKDLRGGVEEGTRQITDLKQQATEAPGRLITEARSRVDREFAGRGDQLAGAALGAGFVAGGGIGATARLPLRIVGMSSSRSEVFVRRNRHSRQVGRALAGVAAADRQLRGSRGLFFTNARRLALLAPVAAGIAALIAQEDKLPDALVEPREKLLNRIFEG